MPMRALTTTTGLVLLLWQVAFADVINGFDVSDTLIPRAEIIHGGPPRDGIPALTDPRFEPAAAVSDLRDDERVLGLVRNGIAKAYPLSILTWHEIVNDRFGDEPIVVTYCPLCFTGMAFEAALDGRRHHFGVSGLLYNSDVLMYDRESESLWSQLLRQAVSGPHKGLRLKQVAMINTTWGDWRARHRDTLVLSSETGHRRDYGRDPYAGYERSPDVLFPVKFRAQGYHPKEPVLGIQIDGVTRAYPVSELAHGPAEFRDRIGEREVIVRYDDASTSAEILGPDGKVLPSVMAYWFAWYTFNPETQVYKHRPADR
jgi:hypothetical protein